MVGQLGQMGIQMGAQGLLMKYPRSDESQADAERCEHGGRAVIWEIGLR